jgi:glutamate-ammonia-ligase adenylyltransferase
VKLQRGGIREIEFIAQALQLAHGGHDEWLRVGHTLISLGRLADRDFISEQESSELSDAYSFLRMLEHRLQMEHGLQTHTVPDSLDHRSLIARRMNSGALEGFDSALNLHVANVRRAYDRVFAGADETAPPKSESFQKSGAEGGAFAAATAAAARIFASHVPGQFSVESLVALLNDAVSRSVNAHRAGLMTARVAASLDKSENQIEVTEENLLELVRLCGTSEFFSEMVAGNPSLITSLQGRTRQSDYRAQLRAAIDPETNFPAELSAFRRAWSRLLIEIGVRDSSNGITLAESNSLQTELAVAALNVAYLISRREIARRYGRMTSGPRLSVLALGRLASGGVDYGSDLDIILVYDSLVSSPVASLTQDEAYARLAELMNVALSSVTRDGYLYRVDLRLRPNGKNGPLVISSESFLDYVRHNSAVWEWLAYAKLRAVAGDLELGRMIETHARHAVHERAQQIDPEELRTETRRVRELLEKEKGGRARRGQINIKYAAGSMLDVYFAVRYLQLRDDVSDEGADRSTSATLEQLKRNNSLTEQDYEALTSGYRLLRSVDHQVRLIIGKVAALPSITHPAFEEIATRLKFASGRELSETLIERMRAVRDAYERITS